MLRRCLTRALALTLTASLLWTAVALADTATVDGDTATAAVENTVDLGTVAGGAVLTPTSRFLLTCTGKEHPDQGQTVNFTFALAQSTVPAGSSLTATNGSIGPIPASWPDDATGGGSTNCAGTPQTLASGDGGAGSDSTVTITAPMDPGSYTYIVRWNMSLSPTGNGDPQALVSNHTTVTYQLTVSGGSSNTAPVISAATFGSTSIGCNTGTSIAVSFTDDPSSTSWTYSVDWENDGTFDDVDLVTGLSSPGTFSTSSHTYPLPGSYTAAVKVTDNQGLESTTFLTTNSLTVNQTYEVAFLKPVDGMVMGQSPEIVNSGKLGRVWPVKVSLFDNCGDTGWVNDPAAPPTISLLNSGIGNNVLTDSLEQYSAGSSNTGLYFRWTSDASFAAGGYWIFNLDSANPPGGWALEKGSVYRVDVFVGSTRATGSTATSQFAKIKPV